MEHPLLPVLLSFATTKVGRHQTPKSKMLEVVTANLATPPIDPNKSSTLIIDLIAAIRMMTKILRVQTANLEVIANAAKKI